MASSWGTSWGTHWADVWGLVAVNPNAMRGAATFSVTANADLASELIIVVAGMSGSAGFRFEAFGLTFVPSEVSSGGGGESRVRQSLYAYQQRDIIENNNNLIMLVALSFMEIQTWEA